jgi:phosphoadenosine phosphosulfate reductase
MDFINQTYRRYKNIREVSQKNPDLDFQQLASSLEKKTKEEHVVIKEDCDSFDVMPLSKAEEQGKAPIYNSNIEMYIISFSGGKDSQVTLDLVTRVIPSDDLKVIYSNTGYELPSSLELYKQVEAIYKDSMLIVRIIFRRFSQEVDSLNTKLVKFEIDQQSQYEAAMSVSNILVVFHPVHIIHNWLKDR